LAFAPPDTQPGEIFSFEVFQNDPTGARRGQLNAARVIETPVFIAGGHGGDREGLTRAPRKPFGAKIILANTYFIFEARPRTDPEVGWPSHKFSLERRGFSPIPAATRFSAWRNCERLR